MIEAPEILLVEDNPDEAELARRALAGLNCRVKLARDGVKALEFLVGPERPTKPRALPPPRVVMLDLKLPAVDGFEVLRRIRAEPATRLIPVVILTSSNQPSDVRRAYALGANSYLMKPVDFDQFLELMKRAASYWLESNLAPPT